MVWLSGGPPFSAANLKELRLNVDLGKFKFRVGLNPEIKQLIQYMLESDPVKRPTCDQVLKVPIIARNIERWSQPITEAEKKELIQNYINSTSFDQVRETPQDVLRFAEEKQSKGSASRPTSTPTPAPQPKTDSVQATSQTTNLPTITIINPDTEQLIKQKSNTIDDRKGTASENQSFLKQNTTQAVLQTIEPANVSQTQSASNRGSFVNGTGDKMQAFQVGADGNLVNKSSPVVSNYGSSTPQRVSLNPDFKLFTQTPPNTTRETSREPTFRRYVIDQSPILVKTEIGTPSGAFGQFVKSDTNSSLNQAKAEPAAHQLPIANRSSQYGQEALTKRLTGEETTIGQPRQIQQTSRPATPTGTINPSQIPLKPAQQLSTKPNYVQNNNKLTANEDSRQTPSTEPAKRVIYVESSKNRIISSISEQKDGVAVANYNIKEDSKFEQKIAFEVSKSLSSNQQASTSVAVQQKVQNQTSELKPQQVMNKSNSFINLKKDIEPIENTKHLPTPLLRPVSATEKQTMNQSKSPVRDSYAGKNVIFENVRKWNENAIAFQSVNQMSVGVDHSLGPNQKFSNIKVAAQQNTSNDQNVKTSDGRLVGTTVEQTQNNERNSMYQFATPTFIDSRVMQRPSMEVPRKNVDLSPSGAYHFTVNAPMNQSLQNDQQANLRLPLESPPTYPRSAAPPNTPVLNINPKTETPISKNSSFKNVLEVDFASALLSKASGKTISQTVPDQISKEHANLDLRTLPPPNPKNKSELTNMLPITPSLHQNVLPPPIPKQPDQSTPSKPKSDNSQNHAKHSSSKRRSKQEIAEFQQLDASRTSKKHIFSPPTSIRMIVNKALEKDPKKFPPLAKGDKPAAKHPNVTFVDYFEHKKYQASGQKSKPQNDFKNTDLKLNPPNIFSITPEPPVVKTEARPANELKTFPPRKDSSKNRNVTSGRLLDTSIKSKGNKSSSRIIERADVSRSKVKDLLVNIEKSKVESMKKIENSNYVITENPTPTGSNNLSPTKPIAQPAKDNPQTMRQKHYAWNDFLDIENKEEAQLTTNRRGIDVKVISRERSAQRRPEFKTLDETIGLKVKQPDVFGSNLKWEG